MTPILWLVLVTSVSSPMHPVASPVQSGQDAAAVSTIQDPLLDLYAEAYGSGLLAFLAVPAKYRGGPADPRYLRLKKDSAARLHRVRALLVAKFGAAPIEQIETGADEEIETVFFTDVRAAAEHAREQYAALLLKLEHRAAKLKRR